MLTFVDWMTFVVPFALACGAVGYFGGARINRRPPKHFGADERLVELQARRMAQSSSKPTVESMRRPVYALTNTLLAHTGVRVQRVDPNSAPGASDCLWLSLAAGEDNIGDVLLVRPVDEDKGLWRVLLESTFKFQRPVTRWSLTGSMDEVVKGVMQHLAESSKRIEVRAAPPVTRSEYRIDLHDVKKMSAFVAAFNNGLIERAGGQWNGQSWDAFNDYLSWPPEESYDLLLKRGSRRKSACLGSAHLTGRYAAAFVADRPTTDVRRCLLCGRSFGCSPHG